jgi:hypothetical protein
MFWDEKAEWHPQLEDMSKSTRLKLRQVLFRMMREAEILSTDGTIQTAYLTPRVKSLILKTRPADLAVFPGVSLEETFV